MTTPAPRSSSNKGVFLVIVLVAIGVAGALIGVKYSFWTNGSRPKLAPEADRLALEQAVNDAVRVGKSESQRHYVEELATRYPSDPKVRSLLGKVYTDLGRADDALAEFKASLELDEKQPGVHVLVGTLYLNAGNAISAEEHYARAVALDPDELWYRYHLAHAQRRLKQYDRATLTLLDAIKRDPEKHYLFAGLCDVYKEQNRMSLALTAIDDALKHSMELRQRDDHVKYLREKARLLMRESRAEEAIQTLDELSSQERLDPEVIEQLAVAWQWQEQPEKGAQLYEDALLGTRASPQVAARYATGAVRWYIRAGDRANAQLNLQRLQSLNPNASEVAELTSKIAAIATAKDTP